MHSLLLAAMSLLVLCLACKADGGGDNKSVGNGPAVPGPVDPNAQNPGGAAATTTAGDGAAGTTTGAGTTGAGGTDGGSGMADGGGGVESGTTVGDPQTSGHIAIAGTLAINTTDAIAVALPLRQGAVDPSLMRTPPSAAIIAGQIALSIDASAPALGLTGDAPGGDTTHVVAYYEPPPSGKRMDLIDTLRFVEMPVAGSDSLVGLPTSELKTPAVDLGAIADDGTGKLVAATAATDALFAESTADLTSRAKSDDTMKSVKNTFVNTDPATGVYYQPRLIFLWKARLEPEMLLDDDHVKQPYLNQDANAGLDIGHGDYPRYFGYNIGINTNDPELTLAKACKDLADDTHDAPNPPHFKLSPASGHFQLVSEHETVFDDASILDVTAFDSSMADQSEAKAGDHCVFQKKQMTDGNSMQPQNNVDMISFQNAGDTGTNITFGGPRVVYGPVVPGTWTFERDGAPIAKFDLSVSDAIETRTIDTHVYRRPTVFVPGLQIIKQPGTDVVDKIRVRLYTYDLDEATPANSAFAPAPMGVVRQFVKSLTVGISNSARDAAYVDARTTDVPGDATYIDMGNDDMHKFVLPPKGGAVPSGKLRIWTVQFGYEMFGNRYELRFRCGDDNAQTTLECEP